MLDQSIDKNKQLIKEAEVELLDHVQRLAVMEESEMRRMATEISLVEETAANHGKKRGWFNRPKLQAEMRRKNDPRRFMQVLQAEDDKKESEWNRALIRGSKFIVKDPKAHFAMKSKIRNRMLELAQILSTSTEHVKDSLQDMFWMDKRLAQPLVKRETLSHEETLEIAIQA